MRTWRKAYSGIIRSEKIANVSDSAKWLYLLLLVSQDDDGKYPWTPTKIKALTVGTSWTRDVTDSLASECSDVGLTYMGEGFIYIVDGAEKNGTPSNSKSFPLRYEPLEYPYDDSATTRTLAATTSKRRVEKRREEKSREEKIRAFF